MKRMRPRLALVLLLLLPLFGSLLAGRNASWGLPEVARGQVVHESEPVPDAIVRWQAETASTRTDQSGSFTLPFGRKRITAAREGFLIASAPAAPVMKLQLRPLPAEDDTSYVWVDPVPDEGNTHACGECHGEIYKEWAGSRHAGSGSNHYFRNLYDGTDVDGRPNVGWGLLTDHPDGAGVCASCHAPAIPDEDDAFLDLRNLQGTARQGIHCDFCHKIAGPGGGTIGLTHGRYGLRLLRPGAGNQLFFGPLDDVDRGEDSYSPFYHDSRYCASCHEGVVFGVPVYTTYSEWLESPARRAGKQCQDCHMAPTGRMANVAPGHGGLQRPANTLANHRFFDHSQEEMLRRSVRVTAEIQRFNERLRVRLKVAADGAGHRVPTGFVDRHLILVVDLIDTSGRWRYPLEGPELPQAAGRELAGKPGRLYAKLLRSPDGRSPVPFWSDAPLVADTRLVPGQPDVLDFYYHSYGLSEVRVRMLYRRFWNEVAQAKGWPERDVVVLKTAFGMPPQ
jgi:hypothetical protein